MSFFPTCKARFICEDVRCEVNGMQTLVGVLSVIPAPGITDQLFPAVHLDALVQRLRQSFAKNLASSAWTNSRSVAQAEVEFVLKEMEGHATNVHYFGGVQFQQYGMHHVEIYLENELRLRFPLPVIQVQRGHLVKFGNVS